MKMTITENDKKILSYLAAFLIVFFFVMVVFRPLLIRNEETRKELSATVIDIKNAQRKQNSLGEIKEQESQVTQKAQETLTRFYPILESQEAEKMITTLLLNHHFQIQSLTISMSEIKKDLKPYLYAEIVNADDEESELEEPEEEHMQLTSVRINCVADGTDQDCWALLEDLSEHYPAISIAGVERSSERMSLNLEIFMCNQ